MLGTVSVIQISRGLNPRKLDCVLYAVFGDASRFILNFSFVIVLLYYMFLYA